MFPNDLVVRMYIPMLFTPEAGLLGKPVKDEDGKEIGLIVSAEPGRAGVTVVAKITEDVEKWRAKIEGGKTDEFSIGGIADENL